MTNLAIDNDVARKLSQYGLLRSLEPTYECAPEQHWVLPTLRFQLKLNDATKAIKILGSEKAYEDLKAFLLQAQEISSISVEAANLILGIESDNIDSGERVLLAHLLTEPHHILLTGDKRAICALGNSRVPSILIANKHRIECLEAIVLRFLEVIGFNEVSDAIRRQPQADVALSLAFGRSEPAPLSSVVQGLTSYLSELVQLSAGFYVAPPDR